MRDTPCRSRLLRRPAALLAAAIALCAVGTADAQQVSPFSIRANDASPAAERARAGAEAGQVAPPAAAPGDGAAATAPAAPLRPPPFDINGDGRAPQVVVEPQAERAASTPATTLSPLTGGDDAIRVLPVDATNREQRGALGALLKQESDTVRELRVTLDNEADWVDSVVDRPIVPYSTLRLDGEIGYAAWNFYISAGEAARGGTLSVAFTNSVLVLPEASRLLVYLNGSQIAQTAIDSPERTKVIALPISPNLLRAGENALRIEAEMRHRIDCSIDATYELWTRIDTRLTGFSFPGGRLPLAGLDDLPAVGVGTSGATRIHVMQANPRSSGAIDRMLQAAQMAALRGHFAHPLVEVGDLADVPAPVAGTLNIVIGPYDQVRRAIASVPAEAASHALTTLMDTANLGPTVFITGPDERAVSEALTRFDLPEGSGAPRTAIAATPPWLVPGSVPVEGADTITLREAGVETIEFSGRRFKTRFRITLPPDFYAAAYGEVRLYLDAAYSGEVEPGSGLELFVNGTLSTVIKFTSRDGQVFDDYPIELGMQSFRPGVNTIEIVANLDTKADATCLPGGTVQARKRFALFSSTRLVFPAFARIGRLPDLASFATNGFPYPMSAEPVRLQVGTGSLDTVGAAGTLMARLAASRGATLPTAAVEQVDPYADAGVIVVAPLQDVPALALETTGAADVVPQSWLRPRPDRGENSEPAGLDHYDAVLRRLRQQLRQDDALADGPPLQTPLVPVGAEPVADQRFASDRDRWFQELNHDSGIAGLLAKAGRMLRDVVQSGTRFGHRPSPDTALMRVPDNATLLIAQARAPDNETTAWTLVTAPTAGLLSSSLAAVGAPDNWSRIGGRITAYALDTNQMETIAAGSVGYLATVPLSFGNFRLIAANWFSINSGVYSIALVLVAMALGLVTWLLVTGVGRINR